MGRVLDQAVYLQLAKRGHYHHSGDLRLVSATADAPTKRSKDTVVVKVRVRIPSEAFDPAKHPEAVVTVPLEALSPVSDSIEVEAESPYEPAGT